MFEIRLWQRGHISFRDGRVTESTCLHYWMFFFLSVYVTSESEMLSHAVDPSCPTFALCQWENRADFASQKEKSTKQLCDFEKRSFSRCSVSVNLSLFSRKDCLCCVSFYTHRNQSLRIARLTKSFWPVTFFVSKRQFWHCSWNFCGEGEACKWSLFFTTSSSFQTLGWWKPDGEKNFHFIFCRTRQRFKCWDQKKLQRECTMASYRFCRTFQHVLRHYLCTGEIFMAIATVQSILFCYGFFSFLWARTAFQFRSSLEDSVCPHVPAFWRQKHLTDPLPQDPQTEQTELSVVWGVWKWKYACPWTFVVLDEALLSACWSKPCVILPRTWKNAKPSFDHFSSVWWTNFWAVQFQRSYSFFLSIFLVTNVRNVGNYHLSWRERCLIWRFRRSLIGFWFVCRTCGQNYADTLAVDFMQNVFWMKRGTSIV